MEEEDRTEDYVGKETTFVHIPSVYLCQPMNFSANPSTWSITYVMRRVE